MKEDAAALLALDCEYSVPPHRFVIPADNSRFYSFQGRIKRLVDVVVSTAAIVVLSPLFVLLALLVKRSSAGPVFFEQERLGIDGQPFRFYKFRTMLHNSDDAIHRQFAAMFINGDGEPEPETTNDNVFKLQDDPRITRIGKWLRKSSLDELPQLFNILRGDMSLVGPRPPICYEIDNYQPWHLERLKVTPGLTGLWQVSGRSQVPFEEMVRLDVHYINNWSLALDFQILFKTIPVVLRGTGGC